MMADSISTSSSAFGSEPVLVDLDSRSDTGSSQMVPSSAASGVCEGRGSGCDGEGSVSSLVPRPPCPAFVACIFVLQATKAGRGGLGTRLKCEAVEWKE